MQADALRQGFTALADPTRRAILKRLAAGPANVKELSRPFDMSGPRRCASTCASSSVRAWSGAVVKRSPARASSIVHHRKLAAIGFRQTAERVVAYLERRTPWDS